ncbi:DKNYY domain-containing protein [Candidatus Kaiserbacteria bacterium]|nr:DKNYY domain-containing protein [Candidatus Kaiserbacteria bacterium]
MNKWVFAIGILILLGVGRWLLLQDNGSKIEKQAQQTNESNNFGYVIEYGRVDFNSIPLEPSYETPALDLSSFKALSSGFIQDRHGIYFTRETPDYVYYEVVPGADLATFIAVGDLCAKDRSSYYLIKYSGEHYGAELQKVQSLDQVQCTFNSSRGSIRE